MDLGTIRQKLDDKKYTSSYQVLDDISQIWENAKTFNQSKSTIVQHVRKLAQFVEELIREYTGEL